MIPDDMRTDPVLRLVSSLEPRDVGAERAQRLRARCHAALARQGRGTNGDAPTPARGLGKRTAGAALLTLACAIYVIEAVRQALAIYGL